MGRRLDSWKEIADHLGRDVSTAIRWEKERGLPVRRVPGEGRPAVFAYTAEIDSWLAGAGSMPDLDTGAIAEPVRTAPRNSPPWKLAASAVAVVAAGLALARSSTRHTDAGPIARLSVGLQEVTAWGQDAAPLWTFPLPRPANLEFMEIRGTPRWTVARWEGDGGTEVLAAVSYAEGGTTLGDELLCLSATGRLRWRRSLDDELTFSSGSFGPPWHAGSVIAYDVGQEHRIAWAQNHHQWWPAILEILDGRGARLATFIHSGHIYALATLDTVTGPLILAGGVSNSHRAAMMAVLDGANPSGTWPEEPGSPYACQGCAPGRPLKYFLFPPSDVSTAEGGPYNYALSLHREGPTVELQTREYATAAALFTFSEDLTLQGAAFSDSYPSAHDRLWREGKLDHSWEKCPHRAPKARSWDPGRGWRDLTPAGPSRAPLPSPR